MTIEQTEMLIRHDEQLRSLSLLPAAVNELTTQLRVANARAATIAACIGVAGSVMGCIGTWAVMVHFVK
jgi:hypothetical protein